MQLSKDEERIFDGEAGEGPKIAIRLLNSLGELGGAERLIPVKSAHISGVSYKNVGEGGIQFLRKISHRVNVPTSLNPLGFDIDNGGPVDIDDTFRKKQMEIVEIYREMGVMDSFTCTPYYYYNEPSFGDHISWAESSAIIYVNSLIGARTNRESGPSALAAAIIGKTPDHGLHRKDGRRASVVVNAEGPLDYTKFAALGLFLGPKLNRNIPIIKGQKGAKGIELKALSAALSATSSIPMFHVEGVTRESDLVEDSPEVMEVGIKEIEETIGKSSSQQEPELIAIGCPHLSSEELDYIAGLVKGKKKVGPDLFLFTSREVKAKSAGAVKTIENFGGKVFSDTCMVVSPLSNNYKSTGTNSGKASFYLPLKGYGNQKVAFMGIMDLLRWVIA
ncbi:MAG: aconitase X catalytic domain-containing protein [Candidatus Thermoplasmatota archaeon]|nr:aconitase X catalytic domain-containing protein [Candidatus Thermoplasmatota archaeon]MCL5790204.1 aconitase X catalytic domain-containing protein [Candidatus Thermoplasmatota archaeon]